MRTPLFILTVIPWVWGNPVTDQPTEQDQTRTGQVSDQLVCYNVTDPEAKDISVIYNSKDDRRGRSLPVCSESESVELNTCRVCELQEQVLALCNLTNPSADLDLEASGKDTPLQKTLCVFSITLTPTTAPLLQPTTPSTAPPLQPTTPSTAPPPRLIAGIVFGVLVVAVVAVGVAFTQRENIGSWVKRRRHTRVPTRDQKVEYRAPAANGHAPSLLEALSPDTGAESVSEGQFSSSD